ncbi:MAG: alpha/beta fold hydrolase [Candidatus Omnitrophica bacterium]|nr:alpha/beta fold hydrolase [Candidatus Omnitrophota bacterium]MBU1996127.1 alpha/beta fold hydrolase [Candidatus Omnitrophota bacterium]
MQGKVIWKEVIVYLYFFSSVSIILFLMRASFKKIAESISKKIIDLRFQKIVYLTVAAFLWTFILLPYILATFTIHRPKIGDKYDPETLFMFKYEKVSLKTQDGLHLKGWFIPKKNSNKAVVIGHGLGANKSNFLSLVELWEALNYNVLIFDFRGHGESGGHTISFGYKEKYDIRSAFDYLNKEKKFLAENIVGYGVSFGGASLIQAVNDGAGFDKMITDSSFASIDTMADKVVERMGFVPVFLRESIKDLGLAYVNLELGFNIDNSSPIRISDKIKIPWLIIHGKKDVLIPSQEAISLYGQGSANKQLYLVDKGEHYTTIDDVQYIYQIRKFLNQ